MGRGELQLLWQLNSAHFCQWASNLADFQALQVGDVSRFAPLPGSLDISRPGRPSGGWLSTLGVTV